MSKMTTIAAFACFIGISLLFSSGSLKGQTQAEFDNGIPSFKELTPTKSVQVNQTTNNAYYTRGNIVTHPGEGSGGADFFYAYDDGYGRNCNLASPDEAHHLCVVYIPEGNVEIDHVVLYAYQQGSSTTSTITSASMRVFDGNPTEGIIDPFWGNLSTDIMETTYWSGCYYGDNFSSTDRPIMIVKVNTPGLVIPEPGTYYFNFGFTGSNTSGPWCPPIGAGDDVSYWNDEWLHQGFAFPIDIYANNSCETPTHISTTIEDLSATIEFESESNLANIEYGPKGFVLGAGTQMQNVSSPVTIDNLLELSEYDVFIQSICGEETGYWSLLTQFNTICTGNSCGVTFNLYDSYGDGWNGAKINIYQNDIFYKSMTISSGSSYLETLELCNGSQIEVEFIRGSWVGECGLDIIDEESGDVLFSFEPGDNPSEGLLISFFNDCSNCQRPKNFQAYDIGATDCMLSWDSYNPNQQWIIEYGEEGFAPGSGTIEIASGVPFNLQGLIDNQDYDIYVKAICSEEESFWSEKITISTTCLNSCNLIFNLYDSYGDGWHNNEIRVFEDGELIKTLNFRSGSSLSDTLLICEGNEIELYFQNGDWSHECGFSVLSENSGEILYSFEVGDDPSSGLLTSFIQNCSSCITPFNVQFEQIGTTSVNLSWELDNIVTNTEIVCVEAGASFDEGLQFTSSGNSLVIQNLKRNTTYNVYLKSVCTDDEGFFNNFGSFTTLCAIVYNASGPAGPFCPDYNQANVSLNNSEAGIHYSLLLNNEPTETTVVGVGGFLNVGNVTVEGDYTVMATDPETGCETIMNGLYTYSTYPAIEYEIELSEDILCYNDESASIQFINVNDNYQYSIDGGENWSDNNIFENLSANEYITLIKDNQNCLHYGVQVVFNNPDQLIVSSIFKTNLSASGASDGAIIITAEGGTGSISYSIDNGQSWKSSNGFSNLPEGEYTVVVNDENGCSAFSEENPVVIEFKSGSADINKQKSILVYPNPSTGEFTVNCSGFSEEVTIQVSNAKGQVLYSNTYERLPSGDVHMPVKLENYKPGKYILQLYSGHEVQSQSLILK
jgi:hypothetical protein